MRDKFYKIQLISRWFAIVAVFAGLCFSSGEGIQLFPFPAVPAHEESRAFSHGRDKLYSFSVHNSANQPGVGYSKIQKNLKIFDCPEFFSRTPSLPKFSVSEISQHSPRPAVFNSTGLENIPSDRAPPSAAQA